MSGIYVIFNLLLIFQLLKRALKLKYFLKQLFLSQFPIVLLFCWLLFCLVFDFHLCEFSSSIRVRLIHHGIFVVKLIKKIDIFVIIEVNFVNVWNIWILR